MTRLFCLLTVSLFILLQNNLSAESSKKIKVDLDVKTTLIVKADIGQDGWYYYVDVNACVCWVGQVNGGSTSASTFDCSQLKAHPRLAQYVEKCEKPKVTVQLEAPAQTPAAGAATPATVPATATTPAATTTTTTSSPAAVQP